MNTYRIGMAGALTLALPAAFIGMALLAETVIATTAQPDPLARPAIASAGCGVSEIEHGQHPGAVEIAGVERSWQLEIPPNHDGETPLPLVIGLHGGHELVSSTSLLALAREEGFVAATPRDAYQDWWMVWEPQLPGYDLSLGNPDIAFIDALIDQLSEELCLDLARVYSTGFSIGAGGASVLGCVLDDRIAAVAPVGALTPDLGETCNTERPVSILAIHGTKDVDVFYDGGFADWFLDTVMKDGSHVRDSQWGRWLMSDLGTIPDRVDRTAVRYGCEPGAAIEPLGKADRFVWACPDNVDVEHVAFDGGHVWMSDSDGRTTEQLIWDFFEGHPMPE